MENIKTEKTKEEVKSDIFKKIAKRIVYLLVFLIPLFFLPWTISVLEFNKQALLLFLGLLALACWLISVLISNKLEIKVSFMHLPVAVLVLATGIATAFSLSPYGSFWGWPLIIPASLLSLFGLVVFYFLIVNLFSKKEIPFLFLTLIFSGFLVSLLFIFHSFGVFVFPFDFAKTTSFNTVGTVNSLSVYFSLLLLMVLPLLFFVKSIFRTVLAVFSAFLLFSLILINFQTAWIILLAGTAALLAFGIVKMGKQGKTSFVVLAMVFLVVALLFTFFRFPIPAAPVTPFEVSPTQGLALSIYNQLPLQSKILGSGPGTFSFDWSRYKAPEINETVFWATRFGSAPSEFLERLITTGLLGFLAFIFFLGVFLKIILNLFLKEMESKSLSTDWFLILVVATGFIGLVFAFLLYPANLSVLMVFWLLAGCLVLLGTETKKTWDLAASSTKSLIFSFAIVLILILGTVSLVFYSQKYIAEVRYYQGLQAWQKGDTQQGLDYLMRAFNLNPKNDTYLRDLSQVYLIKLDQLLARTDLTDEQLISEAQVLIANSVNSATEVTKIEPNNVANWNVRGFVYRNMIGILGGADEWAINSYQRAAALDPTSPYILSEIGQAYLARADILAQQNMEAERIENLRTALAFFEKAVELKSNYMPAHFQIAMISVREDKIAEAIERLESIKQTAPFDTGLAFQLGLIYYNDEQLDKARVEFERAVLQNPNFSNARYFLGLIYDRQGERREAIDQFETIEQLNPGNQEVKDILSNLRAGRPALDGIIPSDPPEPPILEEEEVPEEVRM